MAGGLSLNKDHNVFLYNFIDFMINFSIKGATTVAILGGIVASAVSASAALNLPTMSCSYKFNTNLRMGSRGADVMNLQKVLNMYPQTRVSTSGAGSPGMESEYFGLATRAAANAFQRLHLAELGISSPTGNVFAGTRGLLNQVCNGNVNPNPNPNPTPGPVSTGPVTGMLGSNQPSSFLVTGQASARIAEYTFSGTGVVKSVKLMRTGLSDDSTLTNVYLYEGMTRIAGPASVAKDGTVLFNSVNGLFAVTGMKNVTVRGDVATGKSGSTIGFALVGIDAGTGMTSMSNVTGPTLQIGSVTLAGVDMTAAALLPAVQSLNAGSVAQNVWERTFNVNSRSVTLDRAQFKMIGSAPASSVANVTLNVDGMTVANGTVDSNGYIAFVPTMTGGYVLTTGNHTIKVFADIVGGSDRSFYVSLENASDILLEDSQVAGAYVMYTVGGSTSATSNILGGTVTIQGGSIVITQDTTLNNVTTVVGGATNQTLAKWNVTSYGEDVKITSLAFLPTITGTGNTLTNVGMFVNGAQLRSNQTATSLTNVNYTDLGTNFIVPTGKTVSVEIRADLITASGTPFTTGTVKFDIANGLPNVSNAQGVYSQKVSSVGNSTGQSKTIGTSNVNFAVTAGSAAKSVAPNSVNTKIGSFTVQTGSTEGVNITSIAVTVANGTLLTATTTKMVNLKVMDGSTQIGTTVGLPTTGDNTYSANINVPVSTTKTLDVYADINGGSAGLTVQPTMKVYYTGLQSRQSNFTAVVSGVVTTANVGTIVPGGVTFVPASSPVAQFVIGGSSLMIAKFNVKSNNGIDGAKLRDLVFTVATNTISSITVNGKTASVVGTTATISGADFPVPADASGLDLLATASLVCATSTGGCSGVSSTSVTLAFTSFTYHDGETVQPSATTSAITPSHVLVASKPTITLAQSSGAGLINGKILIGTFTIAADAAGDIEVKQIPVTVSSSTGITLATTTLELRDSAGSTIITGSNALGASGIFVLSTARRISKGTSETYTVYGTFSGVSGAAGTASVTFGLGGQTSFFWNDVAGGVNSITGQAMNTYPTNTQNKTN